MTFLLTVVVVLAIGWAVINFGPVGWRTQIFHSVALFAPGLGELLQQAQVVDWSKLVDVPKVAYGLAVGIPLVGAWLRQLTRGPVGSG